MEENRKRSTDSQIVQPDAATRQSGNNVDFEMVAEEKSVDDDEESGTTCSRPIREFVGPAISFDNTSAIAENIESGDIENASSSSNNGEGKIDRVRVKPIFSSPSILGTFGRVSFIDNSSSGNNNDITLNRQHDSNIQYSSATSNVGDDSLSIFCADRVRVKPNNIHTETSINAIESFGPPLCDITEHLMIDHVHVPITRQNSLEANLTNYETAHLLSDKIMVITVQVIIWIQKTCLRNSK